MGRWSGPTWAHPGLELTWRAYVCRPDDLDAWEFGHPDAPHVGGVYFLWGKDGGLLYVGQSYDVLYRMCQHYWARKIPFHSFSVIEVPAGDDVLAVELAYICALEPPHNRLFGPIRWDGHSRMARIIKRLWRASFRETT